MARMYLVLAIVAGVMAANHCCYGQQRFMAMRFGGAFNPLNNANHPANIGIANAMAFRNQFPWAPVDGNPFSAAAMNQAAIRNVAHKVAAVRPQIVVQNSILPEIEKQQEEIQERVQELIQEQISAVPGYRPVFVDENLKERFDKIKELEAMRKEEAKKRKELIKRREQVIKKLIDNEENLELHKVIGVLMEQIGKERAQKGIEHSLKMQALFDKPFLRPSISIDSVQTGLEMAAKGIQKNDQIRTNIFQNFQEVKGTLRKGEDFIIMIKVRNFTGDVLDLKVHLDSVKEEIKNIAQDNIQKVEAEIEKRKDELISRLQSLKMSSDSSLVKERIESEIEFAKMHQKMHMDADELDQWIKEVLKEEKEIAQSHMETQLEMQKQQMQLQKEIAQRKIELQREIAKAAIENELKFREAVKEQVMNLVDENIPESIVINPFGIESVVDLETLKPQKQQREQPEQDQQDLQEQEEQQEQQDQQQQQQQQEQQQQQDQQEPQKRQKHKKQQKQQDQQEQQEQQDQQEQQEQQDQQEQQEQQEPQRQQQQKQQDQQEQMFPFFGPSRRQHPFFG